MRVPAAVIVVGLLVLGGCTDTGSSPDSDESTTAETPAASIAGQSQIPAGITSPATDAPVSLESVGPDRTAAAIAGTSWGDLLLDGDRRAAASIEDLTAAVTTMRTELGDQYWTGPDSTVGDGPVMLADVTIVDDPMSTGTADSSPAPNSPVTYMVDMTMGLHAANQQVVLRTLAVTDATLTGSDTKVTASLEGTPIEVTIEPGNDRIVVDLGRQYPDGAVVRVELIVTVPDHDTQRVPDRGPASYGLFSNQGEVVVLGHWLPVPVAVPGNDGDVPAWGDMGAFAPATWLVQTTTPSGHLVTGGVDVVGGAVATTDAASEPDAAGGTESSTTLSVGFGLRDLAAAWIPDEPAQPGVVTDEPLSPTVQVHDHLRSWPPSTEVDHLAAAQLEWLAQLLGPLPWHEHDMVAIDMDLAVGMEYPGLVMISEDRWDLSDQVGEYVLIHEFAHQYFHALVGNGSLSDPVVDEPLAQYLSWRWFQDQGTGPVAFDAFIDDGGLVPHDPPGLPANEFRDGRTYSNAIYRTAATAWVTGATTYGVEVVDEAVRAVVDQWALREVTQGELVNTVATVSPALADDLAQAFDQS